LRTLRPAPTAPTLDLASTTQLLDHAKAAGLDVDTDVKLNGHAIPIAVEQAGFRIVQEALTKVMRHAARGVRKLGQAASWYSWMRPPRRSRR
jgi:signal transduction histidine kinase